MNDEDRTKFIRGLLKDADTYVALKTIGFMRNKIWMLHREASELEWDISKLERGIIEKHKIDFAEMIGLSIIADGIFKADIQKAEKEKNDGCEK